MPKLITTRIVAALLVPCLAGTDVSGFTFSISRSGPTQLTGDVVFFSQALAAQGIPYHAILTSTLPHSTENRSVAAAKGYVLSEPHEPAGNLVNGSPIEGYDERGVTLTPGARAAAYARYVEAYRRFLKAYAAIQKDSHFELEGVAESMLKETTRWGIFRADKSFEEAEAVHHDEMRNPEFLGRRTWPSDLDIAIKGYDLNAPSVRLFQNLIPVIQKIFEDLGVYETGGKADRAGLHADLEMARSGLNGLRRMLNRLPPDLAQRIGRSQRWNRSLLQVYTGISAESGFVMSRLEGQSRDPDLTALRTAIEAEPGFRFLKGSPQFFSILNIEAAGRIMEANQDLFDPAAREHPGGWLMNNRALWWTNSDNNIPTRRFGVLSGYPRHAVEQACLAMGWEKQVEEIYMDVDQLKKHSTQLGITKPGLEAFLEADQDFPTAVIDLGVFSTADRQWSDAVTAIFTEVLTEYGIPTDGHGTVPEGALAGLIAPEWSDAARVQKGVGRYCLPEPAAASVNSLSGHYHDRLYVRDVQNNRMISLKSVRADRLSDGERAAAIKSLRGWVGTSSDYKPVNYAWMIPRLLAWLNEPILYSRELAEIRFALSLNGEVEGYSHVQEKKSAGILFRLWLELLEIAPENRAGIRYQGVGQELFTAALFEASDDLPAGAIFEASIRNNSLADFLNAALGWPQENTLSAQAMSFTRQDKRHLLEYQKKRVQGWITQYGIDIHADDSGQSPEYPAPQSLDELKAKVKAAPKFLCLLGPSGAGKSTLIKKLLRTHPDKFVRLLPIKARPPREGNVEEAVDPRIVSMEAFRDMQARNEFVATKQHHAFPYGITYQSLFEAVSSGKTIVVEGSIDAELIKSFWPEADVAEVGILPWKGFIEWGAEAISELKRLLELRMRKRDPSITDSDLETRLNDGMKTAEKLWQALFPIFVNAENQKTPAYEAFESYVLEFVQTTTVSETPTAEREAA